MKTAFITGSARGIGRAIAIRLAKDGFRVILHGVNNSSHIVGLKEEIEKNGGIAEIITANLCDIEETKALADLPNLIKFINEQIEKSCNEGKRSVYFSIDDTFSTPKGNHDKRCIYIVPGKVSTELFENINKIYSSIGFASDCSEINCWGPTRYREGVIDISWYD